MNEQRSGRGFGERDQEAERLLKRYGGAFDVDSEPFRLLRKEFLNRWDTGVPISMMPGSTGALAYLVSQSLRDMMARGIETPASRTTLGELIRKGAKVRQGGQLVDVRAFLRIIVESGFQELAMTAGFGWGRARGGAAPAAEGRYRRVFSAWMDNAATSQLVISALLEALLLHASEVPVTELITVKRLDTGFYGNPDFPVTPPMNYRTDDIKKVVQKLESGGEMTFLLAKNEQSEESGIAVLDWNAKLTEASSGVLLAYCGGTAYFVGGNRKARPTSGAMSYAADQFTGAYEDAIQAFGARSMEDDVAEGPVALVHCWERHPSAKRGVGVQCLEEALQLCGKELRHHWTCFVNAVPQQWRAARLNIGASHALITELQAAELALFGLLERMKEKSMRLPADMDLIWAKAPTYTSIAQTEEH